TIAALDLVVLQRVEVDHHPHPARPKLRVPDVLDAAAVGAVVQHRGGDETRALQVHDESRRTGQREVLDVDGAAEIDHDFHAARRRDHADGLDLAVPRRRSRHPRAYARVSPSRSGTRAAVRFMVLPPAWRAAGFPAARSRTPAP